VADGDDGIGRDPEFASIAALLDGLDSDPATLVVESHGRRSLRCGSFGVIRYVGCCTTGRREGV
jgi:hypothetical protein